MTADDLHRAQTVFIGRWLATETAAGIVYFASEDTHLGVDCDLHHAKMTSGHNPRLAVRRRLDADGEVGPLSIQPGAQP